MGVRLDLKHVKEECHGRYVFRRVYPVSLRADLGQQLHRTAVWRTEKDLLRWWTGLMDEWERTVAAHRAKNTSTVSSPRDQWEAGLARADALVAGVSGLDEDDARDVIAGNVLARYPADPEDGSPIGVSKSDELLVRALLSPSLPVPEHTLHDAMNEYLKERIGDTKGRRGRNSAGSVDRVFGYAFKALGARADLPLSRLGNADGLKVRDFMLARPKQGGGRVTLSSVRRELNILSAALALAIKNFDLELKAKNIFKKIEIQGLSDNQDDENRDPLPLPVIVSITQRLEAQKERKDSALPVLRLIWRILAGTGCRVSEVAGLRVDDVQLDGPTPHIKVRWNEERRVKTKTSVRSVPLCGDAFAAASEALRDAGQEGPLFPRYGGPTGGSNASAALLKHVKAVTPNPKHVVHSLRHNMADWLREAEVPDRAAKLILGHSLGGIGDRVYGGKPADLRMARKAMLSAQRWTARAAAKEGAHGWRG